MISDPIAFIDDHVGKPFPFGSPVLMKFAK